MDSSIICAWWLSQWHLIILVYTFMDPLRLIEWLVLDLDMLNCSIQINILLEYKLSICNTYRLLVLLKCQLT